MIPEIRDMSLAELKPAPYNPRKIDDAALAGLTKSVERFGYVEPIIWNKRSGYVVGGHQRLKVLKTKKVKSVPVVVVDLAETEEKALNVALNSPHISGQYTADLQAILEQINLEDSALFNELRLNELLGQEMPLPPGAEPDHAPEMPKEARTKPGDVYTLGRHRLICGDSTNPETLKALLRDERVDSMVTDPPYGVDYGDGDAQDFKKITNRHRDIANDEGRDYRTWFTQWLALVPWSEYATFYICMSSLELHNLRLALDDCGLSYGDYLVWVKDRLVMGRKDYKARFEPIVYGWSERHKFFGDSTRTTVLEYKRPHKNDLHPTMKPVELIKQLVEDGSPSGAIIYEPFAGSGTTLIACEMTGRQCRAIELDPLYVDVCVDRWEQFTGKKAILNGAA